MKKRVAILTLGVGAGHVRASSVIESALRDGGDDLEILVVDALDLARAWFQWVYVRSYWMMLRYAPAAWKALFERRNNNGHRATAPRWVFRLGCAKVLERFRAFRPELVIANEIGAVEIAALAKREGWFNAPLLAVQTDFHAEPPWVQQEVDFYCVGSGEAREQLVNWGASSHRILVSGIPIDPGFMQRTERPDVLKALGLVARKPVVLVMGGGMGPAPLDAIVRSLEQCDLPLQVIAIAGHNRTMRRRLQKLRGHVTLDLHIFGWTPRVPEFMAAADLLVTKPGGLTMAEALAAGVPMLLTEPIPGPEERHVKYLVDRGAAVFAHALSDIPKLVSGLLTSPARRARMVQRQRELARPGAAHAIAQVARALMEKTGYMDLLAAAALPRRPGETAFVM
ncbi:MAG TPA: glycosyltransferase [Terriglobia bacterium]|nr:glycosyltransferase [Terriglobia bacterium]